MGEATSDFAFRIVLSIKNLRYYSFYIDILIIWDNFDENMKITNKGMITAKHSFNKSNDYCLFY